MKLPKSISYPLQSETLAAHETLKDGTRAHQEVSLGHREGEPLLVIFDALLSYAKTFEAHFGQKIADDYVASPEFSSMLSGARGMLNFNGGVANGAGITTDSKDTGALETLYWEACKAAGIDGDSI